MISMKERKNTMESLNMANFGLWSILPPIIAIILALITREVISSLVLGILVGALIFNSGDPIKMVSTTFEVMGDRIGSNVYILLFLGLLGVIVVLVTRAGGSSAYGEWASKKIKTRKGACLATTALGCLIFIDDYFNCLSVGTVMRPVTDKHRISRAKLAYLLDATAAPICIIAPISSWGASIATYIENEGVGNGMSIFVNTLPYNLYAILTLIMVVIICVTNVNFGPMARFERNAILHNDLHSRSDVIQEQTDLESGKKGKVYYLIVPIAALIVFSVLAMNYTGGFFSGESSYIASFGKCDAAFSLVLGSFLALVLTALLYLPLRIMSFKEFMESFNEGIKSMVPAMTILILAWTISGICSEVYLNTGGYIGDVVDNLVANNANFPVFIIPVITFVIAGFLAFATGTSWGTMALFIPIGIAICRSPQTTHLLMPVLGSILAGAVYGDHISPISDTTILSSTGAQCNHIDHVSSQLPYASLVAVSCAIGYVVMGLTDQVVLSFVVALGCMLLAIWFFNEREKKKEIHANQ